MRRYVGLTVATIQLLTAGVAHAQMSREDIEALRRRGEREGWTFEIGENWATRNSSARLCGLVRAENWEETACFKTPAQPAVSSPTAFDWRDWGGATDVRGQGDCGSC